MQAAEERQRALRAAEGPRPARAVAELFSVLNALETMGRWPVLPSQPVEQLRGGVIDGHHAERRVGVTLDDGVDQKGQDVWSGAAAP